MRKQIPIFLVQERKKSLFQRLKKTPIVQKLKTTAFMRRMFVIWHEVRFHLTFKGYDHGTEFHGYICKLPFDYAELTSTGDIAVCCYLPKNLGNVNRNPFGKVWNSYFSRKLRASMLDGSFRYCDKTLCRSMQNFDSNLIKTNEIEEPRLKAIVDEAKVSLDSDLKKLSLGNDYTCNLECPSCRTGMRKMNKEEVQHQWAKYSQIMAEVGPKLEMIHIAGDGDAFSSQFYDQVIRKSDWEKYPNLKIGFQTNGIALTEKKWNTLPEIVKSRVAYVGISIDGATAPTYEKLRLGGKFENLVTNLKFLATMPDKKKYGFPVNLNMIVQKQNFREIVPLVALGKQLGVDEVGFTYIRDWGTFPEGEYPQHAVHLPEHPEHQVLLEILKDPALKDPAVDMGNLVHLA
jgi:MoaA/NifB/PqqE/SkfB family radical SAM enzyme